MMGWKGRRIGEEEGRIDFALGDEFKEFAVFFLGRVGYDGACGGFGLELGGDIGFLARDNEVMGDEVGKYVAVEAVDTSTVKGAVGEAAGSVDGGEGGKGEISGYYQGKSSEVLGGLSKDGNDCSREFDARIELLNLWQGGFCTLGRN